MNETSNTPKEQTNSQTIESIKPIPAMAPMRRPSTMQVDHLYNSQRLYEASLAIGTLTETVNVLVAEVLALKATVTRLSTPPTPATAKNK
jgi:hypothetical protein